MSSVHENFKLRIWGEHVFYTNCFLFLFWHSEQLVYTACSPHVLSLQFSCTELVIQWTICRHIVGLSWCKNKSFWQRFTCTNRQAGGVANNWRIFLLSGACLDDNASIIVNMMAQGHYFWPLPQWGKSGFEIWFLFYDLNISKLL